MGFTRIFWIFIGTFVAPTVVFAVELSIDITRMPNEPYENAISVIQLSGAQTTSLSLYWDELEPVAGRYEPENDWPSIANAFYPAKSINLTLTFSVIDTNADRRSSDFKGAEWDDPELLEAFARHIDEVMSRMQHVRITSISIGNEVDGFLHSSAEIEKFARFLARARSAIERWRPDMSVGTKITFAALIEDSNKWQPLVDQSSGLHVTYYPINDAFEIRADMNVANDLDQMINVAGDLPVYVLESGYPSNGCGATTGGQLAFFQSLVAAATARADTIKLISLTWLTDLTDTEVGDYGRYYGVDNTCFARYLSSLGIRTQEGAGKPTLTWLQERQ